MAEAEFGGVKFKGGKIFILLTALSTLGGVAWGGFEFYNDYRTMKTKINKYVAPDLSGLQEQLSVLNQKMIGVEERVIEGTDYTRDIKNDLKKDIQSIEVRAESAERRVKTIQTEVDSMLREYELVNRTMEKDVRTNMRDAETRISESMSRLDMSLSKKLQEALDNPLAK
jgi:predicted  nucleic acid-binding Zn-ribbon protein|tara:strand:- start:294 stop:803 length:510 start_codon:yes stop_codon:yes gene_type:complete